MVAIMGTSTCHVMNARRAAPRCPGMCGVVDGGIVAGLCGYEAGQTGVGDIFGWFVEQRRAGGLRTRRPPRAASTSTTCSPSWPRTRPSASTGCWPSTGGAATARCWSTTSCAALLVGATLATRPEDIYRALIEATAFGTRVIIETFEAAGVPVDELVVGRRPGRRTRCSCRSTPTCSDLPLSVDRARTRARRSARRCHAAVAAGAYPDVPGRRRGDGPASTATVYRPIAGQRRGLRRAVRASTCALHDYFGRGDNDVMQHAARRSAREAPRRPPRSRSGGRDAATVDAAARARSPTLHAELPRYDLVVWTGGNVSRPGTRSRT